MRVSREVVGSGPAPARPDRCYPRFFMAARTDPCRKPLGRARRRRARRPETKDAVMTEVIDQTAPTPSETPAAETTTPAPDLATAAQRVLAASDEPLTVSKLRAKLPSALRGTDPKDIVEVLERQVSANF